MRTSLSRRENDNRKNLDLLHILKYFKYPERNGTYGTRVAPFTVYRLPFLPLFFDRFDRFTVYRFFGQKAVKNGKNLH